MARRDESTVALEWTGRASASAAPIDPAGLAPVLDPGGSGSMLPAAAYLDDAVLAWERTHLFAGAWVCAGRSADLADGRRPPGRRASATTRVLLVRGDDGVLRGFYNVCRHRAHELAPCGATSRRTARSTARTTAGATASTARCCRRPGSTRPTASTGPSTGWSRCAVEEWHGWVIVNASRRRAAARRAPRPASRNGVAGARARAPGRRRHPPLRAGDQLEADRRELPRVLPLPEHPPGAVPRQPADERRQLRRPRRALDRRLAGPDAARRDDVADRRVAGRAAARAATSPRGGGSTTSGCCPTCCISLHPDYVMTHRIEPADARPHGRRVPVAVRPGGRRAGGVRPVVRRRLLGPHQPPGLGGLRGRAARRRLPGLPPGPVRRRRRTPSPSSSRLIAQRLPRRRLDR